jgi:ABC-type dipeptide/oligopeptide/nickel transport system permease component
VPSRLLAFVLRRAAMGMVLVLVVSSAALVLARLAPGDHISVFDVDPATAAAERRRAGLDRPLPEQYARWVASLLRLDLGQSTRFPGRPVSALVAERAGQSAVLGGLALVLATLVGIPLGVFTGSRRGPLASLARGLTMVVVATPTVVLALALLLLASRTGWFPVGGLPPGGLALESARYAVLPVTALALPIAAVLERLQARAMADALSMPSIAAARARGLPETRIVWRHAFRLSLRPVLAVYGVLAGALISGSFVVEFVMTWPGLGLLMYDALVYRDANLVAGCAAAGAAFLAATILAADIALAAVDPRAGELP